MNTPTTIALPPELRKEVEEYREKYGLEKTCDAARRLIRVGLKVEANKA